MARRTTWQGERIIEADNGFGWSYRQGYVALSVHPGVWVIKVFGLEYRLVKFGGDPRGWCLYLGEDVNRHFYGRFCAATLLPAIDVASKLIDDADLRGEGYERKES